MALEDFAAYRINFRNKADNLAEILRELNLQPGNAVMIDDNPAERAAVQAVLISAESARRTGMMHAQLRRDSVRRELSQEEFLQSLNLRASIARVPSTSDLHMSRALELFNKTNQFNTTGERYTLEHCHRRFAAGYELYVGTAEDRFTQYGLVTAAWMLRNCVDHVVMSCRKRKPAGKIAAQRRQPGLPRDLRPQRLHAGRGGSDFLGAVARESHALSGARLFTRRRSALSLRQSPVFNYRSPNTATPVGVPT